MCLMSDDDIAMPTSLNIVLKNINAMPNIIHIKYSIDGLKRFPDKLWENFV